MMRCLDSGIPHGSHSAGWLVAAALAAASWSICRYCGDVRIIRPHVLVFVSETVTAESQTSEQKQALWFGLLCAAAGTRRLKRIVGETFRLAPLLKAGLLLSVCLLIAAGCASSWAEERAGEGAGPREGPRQRPKSGHVILARRASQQACLPRNERTARFLQWEITMGGSTSRSRASSQSARMSPVIVG